MSIPRSEHPNPQWKRESWKNLNGEWEFQIDHGKSGLDREIYKDKSLNQRIIVPFCPESELSGIGYTDFMQAVCYRKEIDITKDNLNGRVILHFGAVDYKAMLYVNGQYVGKHYGGYTSFEFDITEKLCIGKNSIFLYAEDNVRSGLQCAGKQSARVYSHDCDYTRTTGIWQTVWIEFVPEKYIKSAKFYPDIHTPSVTITGVTCGTGKVKATSYLDGKEVGFGEIYSCGNFSLNIKLTEKKLWEVGKGGLYDLKLEFENDEVSSYFGLRTIGIDGYKVLINDKPVYQRLVLDQGFYPDGIYTAKTEDDLVNDIRISMDAGFNGARLHEKVFEPLFLYHADRLGYMVWGEYPDWKMDDYANVNALSDITTGWTEAVNRDFNHPSIVGWCPLNELWDYYTEVRVEQNAREEGRLVEMLYFLTKAIDPTRPVVDASGGHHSDYTDVYDFHDYDQAPESLYNKFEQFGKDGTIDLSKHERFNVYHYRYDGKCPFFVSEYGGIKWDVEAPEQTNDKKESWGYGDAPKSTEEFVERYTSLTNVLMQNKNMFGFCYTQLYDVEQERNGIYTYDRKAKFDANSMKMIREVNMQKAKIEE